MQPPERCCVFDIGVECGRAGNQLALNASVVAARGGEINQIFRNAFDRVVLDGEDIATVLASEAANLQALMNETGAACWAPDAPSDGPCQVAPR